MRELVVMEATSQLGFFQVRGNVFVWHLLKASLEKIDFLEYLVNICSNMWVSWLYLFLIPSPASSCRGLFILVNAIVVSTHGIADWSVIGRRHLS